MWIVSQVHEAISKFITGICPPIWQVIFSAFPKTTAPNLGLGIFYSLSFTTLMMDHKIQGLRLLPRIRKHWGGTYLLLQVF